MSRISKYHLLVKAVPNDRSVFQAVVLGFLSRIRLCLKDRMEPPRSVRGMTTLDKKAFKKTFDIPCFKVPFRSIKPITKHFKKFMFHTPGIKSLAEFDSSNPLAQSHKLFLLKPDMVKSPDSFTEQERKILANCDVEEFDEFLKYSVTLGYENWSHSDVLKAVLPEDSDGVAGYSNVGHIVHLNLKPELLPYKHLIGQVLLEKIKTARTVVNKTNIIDNTFRNFQMEVLAGESVFVTNVKENGCQFTFDFSEVYWNSRLATEHGRIVDLLPHNAVLYDVFAGVGPFTIPAAKKKKCEVFANDLNPNSFKWLNQNVKDNKIKGQLVHTYNLDGREFIRTIVKNDILKRIDNSMSPEEGIVSIPDMHITMNLPAMALECLDVFPGLLSQESNLKLKHDEVDWQSMPLVHCYCFSTAAEDMVGDVIQRASTAMCYKLEDATVRNVRNVAPKKEMLCISFRLSKELLLGSSNTCEKDLNLDGAEEPINKKIKTS